MKSYTEYLWFNTENQIEFINIHDKVESAVKKSGIKEGIVLVNAMHITASVYINDAESGLIEDFKEWLKEIAPVERDYRHNEVDYKRNTHSHLMRTIMGREVVVAVTDGKLDIGTWEQIYYGEFDGKRKKRVIIKVIGE